MIKTIIRLLRLAAILTIVIFLVRRLLDLTIWLVVPSVVAIEGIFSLIEPGSKRDGVLEIATDDPDKDSYSLIIETPLEDLPKRSYIHLKVNSRSKHSV